MLQRRTPLRATKSLQRKTEIRKVGRVTRYRAGIKKQWIKRHPPTHQDAEGNECWICHICNQLVLASQMKLDHVLPKGSTPKAIADHDDNLKPSHSVCNDQKGSQRT